MVYICEFEFYDSGGSVDAVPFDGVGEGTFGTDLTDAVESAADWLMGLVDDSLMGRAVLPKTTFGHGPERGGRVIAVAVSREIGDIPAMTAAEAARALGVSSARVSQLVSAGLLDSWKDGTKRMVSKASVDARIEYGAKPGRPCEH